jgi:peptide/nickel transport system ATP-binding protein
VTPLLQVSGLTVGFPAPADPGGGSDPVDVVHGIGFDLEPGRVRALVGESGSGKSVSAMSVLGLLPAYARVSGSVRLEGEELLGASAGRMREVRGKKLGAIFQEPMSAFNPVYRIGWQVAEAIGAHERVGRGATRRRVLDLLASVGLDDPVRVARSYPHELSGGQLQRAMIAMAISGDPVALIADEPTTALDVTVQAGILELIRSLCDQGRGTAVLLITHDMGVVADLADDVSVMRRGRIEEAAPVQTVFAQPSTAYTRELVSAVPRLDALTDRPIRAVDETTDAPAPGATVEVTDARIVYGGPWRRRHQVVAVDGVSLTIAPGRTYGLVGESGSGKSTLGRALAGLVPAHSGRLEVAGIDLTQASRRQLRDLRRDIGYVFQDPASSLDPRWTVGEAIAEPLRLSSDLDRRARERRVAELLDAVRMPSESAGRYQHQLSGGQRQRVAMARAIALKPSLLIADEPTSALDVSVQARVLEILTELQDELGFACLFISHDLAVVRQVAHQVGVMHAGRLVEDGPSTQVLTNPDHDYTRRLLAAAPVADPVEQRLRREAWRCLTTPLDPGGEAA